jgi:hypothetical protein
MPIQAPNLDDRNFDDLVAAAKQFVRDRGQQWTDLGPSDPGVVLIEVFAYLTDQLLYRLNRLPEKAYIAFLRLIGVRLYPPGAARAALRFSVPRPTDAPIEIPRGTRVTVDHPVPGMEPPVFATADAVTIPAQATSVTVTAYHCEIVEAELAGTGTGQPGHSVVAARPPIVAATGDPRDLVVGVEATAAELEERAVAIPYGGRTFRVWTAVESFASTGPADTVYVVDRAEGIVTFAPAVRQADPGTGVPADSEQALAAVPPAGREIRLWYWRGGGPRGNVPAQALTVLKDPIVQVAVVNPEPATGGRAAETLQNALVRGPQDLHSLNRAVTARDFELTATSVGSVARARALTRASLWTFANPGQVEVVLVPEVPDSERPAGHVTAVALVAQQTGEALREVQALLDDRGPLGIQCFVNWAGYKIVTVHARLHVRREEDVARVRDRVLRRLFDTISPLPSDRGSTGLAFGQPLRISDVFYVAQSEPGVRYVDSVQVQLDEVPDADVAALAADGFQPSTWYAASGSILFSSADDTRGWEPSGRFPDQQIAVVRPHPRVTGLVALATRLSPKGARLHVSADCGQSWRQVASSTDFQVTDLAWLTRDGQRLLLVATSTGLYELAMQDGATPVPVAVDAANASRGLYAVAAAAVRGVTCVAVATQDQSGVFFSRDSGRTNTFRHIGLDGADVRVLDVQREGPRAFLWAGQAAAAAGDPGRGCSSWELGEADPPEGWVAHGGGWAGGSVHGLAFAGSTILAASHHGGVMRLASRAADQQWVTPDVNSGLPLRDPGRFESVDAIATDPDGTLVLAGGSRGAALSRDGGVGWSGASRRVLTTDDVTVPPTWLLCSGEHQIEVVSE